MSVISENTKRYKTKDDFLLRKIAGEAVLIPVGAATEKLNGMLTLNETFRFIWEQFKEPHTIQEVLEKTLEEYEGDAGSIEQDIRKFVEESLEYGFMEESK